MVKVTKAFTLDPIYVVKMEKLKEQARIGSISQFAENAIHNELKRFKGVDIDAKRK